MKPIVYYIENSEKSESNPKFKSKLINLGLFETKIISYRHCREVKSLGSILQRILKGQSIPCLVISNHSRQQFWYLIEKYNSKKPVVEINSEVMEILKPHMIVYKENPEKRKGVLEGYVIKDTSHLGLKEMYTPKSHLFLLLEHIYTIADLKYPTNMISLLDKRERITFLILNLLLPISKEVIQMIFILSIPKRNNIYEYIDYLDNVMII